MGFALEWGTASRNRWKHTVDAYPVQSEVRGAQPQAMRSENSAIFGRAMSAKIVPQKQVSPVRAGAARGAAALGLPTLGVMVALLIENNVTDPLRATASVIGILAAAAAIGSGLGALTGLALGKRAERRASNAAAITESFSALPETTAAG